MVVTCYSGGTNGQAKVLEQRGQSLASQGPEGLQGHGMGYRPRLSCLIAKCGYDKPEPCEAPTFLTE